MKIDEFHGEIENPEKYEMLHDLKRLISRMTIQKYFSAEDVRSIVDEHLADAPAFAYEHEEKAKQINKDYETDPMITNKDLAMKALNDEATSQMENVAAATGGNTGGMGAVVTASPSATPGQTTGGANAFSTGTAGDTYGDGGTVGSGDIGSSWSKSKANNKSKKKAKKGSKRKAAAKTTDVTKSYGAQIKNTFDIKNYKQGGSVQSFSEFTKKPKSKSKKKAKK